MLILACLCARARFARSECKFGLNDKLLLDNEAKAKKAAAGRRPGSGIEIDDVSFHQCVKLGKFDVSAFHRPTPRERCSRR